MSESPLPCPFCGYSGPLEFKDGSTHRWGLVECGACQASPGEVRREYPDTGAWHNRGLELWNTRAPNGEPDAARAATPANAKDQT